MSRKVKTIKVDLKLIIIILLVVVVIVLMNSRQETYLSLDERESETLVTVIDQQDTDVSLPTSHPTSIEITYSKPPATNPTSKKSNFLQYVPMIIALGLIVSVLFILLRKNQKNRAIRLFQALQKSSKVRERRARFEVQIKALTELLEDYLERKKFRDGIIFGFHELDKNMRTLLGHKRDQYLTPKEFAKSLELPEIVTHLEKIVELFYLARYRIDPMSEEGLVSFIKELKLIQEKTRAKIEIKNIKREEVE